LYLALKFDRLLPMIDGQKDFFIIRINGKPATITGFSGASDFIRLSFLPAIVYDVAVSHSFLGVTLLSRCNR